MPFHSHAQSRFAFANPHVFGGEDKVKEWADATDYEKIPERAGSASISGRSSLKDDPVNTPKVEKPQAAAGTKTTKPGPKKFSPASSLHRLVSSLVDRKKA